VAENVLKHGTGALNIDACRVGIDGGTAKGSKPKGAGNGIYGAGLHGACEITKLNAGRFPANLIHDGSDEVLALFPDTTSGMMKAGQHRRNSIGKGGYHGNFPDEATGIDTYGDSGSAARFFYCAKVSRSERGDDNHHPTVKPVDLMCYLVRLVCRAGGTVLDPFMGSGTTGIACIREGMKFIGIERDEHYFEIARKRLEAELAQGLLPLNDNQP
jgi:site-specific DNA-methyltransferase (adenine-specific)